MSPPHRACGRRAHRWAACGCLRPVVALGRGGAAETVIDGVTGVHFGRQAADDLVAALKRCDATRFDVERITAHAACYSTERFQSNFRAILEGAACPS